MGVAAAADGFPTVERCFSRLKQFKGFATRYDKLSTRYQAGICPISTIIWLRTF